MSDAGHIDALIEQALEAATSAPSLFNSQPWRVHSMGTVILVCADRSRRLPVHDPLDRELLIACGTYSLYAQIALQAVGLSCAVELLPDPVCAPDVIASLRLRPCAPASRPDDHVRVLADVMVHTQYDRRPFAARPVEDDQLAAMRTAAEAEGAWLVVVDDDRRIEAAVLQTHADEALRADPDAVAELRRWTRPAGHSVDGLTAEADPHCEHRAITLPLRDLDLVSEHPGLAGVPPEPESPLIVLLCTPHDQPADAVTAGRALGRVLLEAAAAGLAASPLNQVLQTGMRWQLPLALTLTGVPQYQLRIGRPLGPRLAMHRRGLGELRPKSGRTRSRVGSSYRVSCSSTQKEDA